MKFAIYVLHIPDGGAVDMVGPQQVYAFTHLLRPEDAVNSRTTPLEANRSQNSCSVLDPSRPVPFASLVALVSLALVVGVLSILEVQGLRSHQAKAAQTSLVVENDARMSAMEADIVEHMEQLDQHLAVRAGLSPAEVKAFDEQFESKLSKLREELAEARNVN